MKLDRNENANGRGKYALLLLRKLSEYESGTFRDLPPNIASALETLDKAGIIDWGIRGSESEFFVTRLKDQNAPGSLHVYAFEADANGDPEWAAEIRELARRAERSPWKKRPD